MKRHFSSVIGSSTHAWMKPRLWERSEHVMKPWAIKGNAKIWRFRVAIAYSEGKKNSVKLFFSHLMSFYPMELIFIGWVGDIWKFYWVLRNFEFKPANEIFWQKGKFPAFQKVLFLEVWCRKLSLSKIGVMDMSYIMDSGQNRLYTTFLNFFSLISADLPDLSHIQKKSFSSKNPIFLDRKSALEGSKLAL